MTRIFSNGTGKFITVLTFLLIAASMAPVAMANSITIDNSSATAINDAVTAAGDGDTIVLSPGTYFEHNITISGKSLTIRANTTNGGSAENTVIDAQSADRIFNVTDTSTLSLDNLGLQNGAVAGSGGGAIRSQGDVAISASTITGCSAESGGAVNSQGNLTLTSSTISGCTSSNNMGGAVYTNGNTTLVSSTITGCRGAQYGGGIYAAYWAILRSSAISNCSANSGGAVTAGGGGVILESSAITDCSAQSGGAIGTGGDVTMTGSSSIRNCSASVRGGGINAGGLVTVISSSITDCSTNGDGGAIQVYGTGVSGTSVSVTSSTIANCSAARGGAVFAHSSGSSSIRFSRLVNNSNGGNAINATFPVTVTDTWWGTNSPDFSNLVNGPVTYDPWLVMSVSASPSSVTIPQNSAVRVTITNTSAGTDTSAGGIFIPDGVPVIWSFTGVSGSILPATGTLVNGVHSTSLAPTNAGTAQVNAVIDSQTVSVPVSVAAAPTPTTSSHGRQNIHHSSAAGTADEGYTGPQPTVMGYTPLQTPKPVVTVQNSVADPGQSAARPTSAMAMTPVTVQKPSVFPVAPVVIGAAAIVVVGAAVLVRRWWIRRQNPALFRKYD